VRKKIWLTAHLFYAGNFDVFLKSTVLPFVKQVLDSKDAEQFFFIRYNEQGMHIRLRFKGSEDSLLSRVKPHLKNYFSKFFKEHPSQRLEFEEVENVLKAEKMYPNNSVQFMDYEPEFERYGGPTGMRISEMQFECSSRAVLSLLPKSNRWNNEKSIGAAIQMHLGFANAFKMDDNDMQKFFERIFLNWLKSPYLYTRAIHDLSEKEMEKNKKILIRNAEESFSKQRDYIVNYVKVLWTNIKGNTEYDKQWLNIWNIEMAEIYKMLQDAKSKNLLKVSNYTQLNTAS